MVRLAGVKAVRYIGSEPKKLWEVGGRNVPILNRGDVVLVGETVGISLCRNRFFIPADVEITANAEPLEEIDGENPPADLDRTAGTVSLEEAAAEEVTEAAPAEAKAAEEAAQSEANMSAGTEPLNEAAAAEEVTEAAPAEAKAAEEAAQSEANMSAGTEPLNEAAPAPAKPTNKRAPKDT